MTKIDSLGVPLEPPKDPDVPKPVGSDFFGNDIYAKDCVYTGRDVVKPKDMERYAEIRINQWGPKECLEKMLNLLDPQVDDDRRKIEDVTNYIQDGLYYIITGMGDSSSDGVAEYFDMYEQRGEDSFNDERNV